MWRRLSTGKGAFSSENTAVNSYELVSTEEDDSVNENHRLLTNGYHRHQSASGNNFSISNYAARATDNSVINSSASTAFGDSNQNHYSLKRRKEEVNVDLDGQVVDGDGENWRKNDSYHNSHRKMLRRSSDRDTSRISSVDNPNYCSVNMAMSVDDVVDATRTPPENRRTSSPYNVMSTADGDQRGAENNGCLRVLGKLLRCTCCCCFWFAKFCFGGAELREREITIGQPLSEKFPPNVIKNQKYNIITFIPLVLFQQFKFFLNLYFLVMACSQFFPDIRIGYWYTYWGPLIFVLTITLIREAIDDLRRRRRDREINSQKYTRISHGELTYIPSSSIKVGDMILVEKDQRVPADMVLIRTSDKAGGFIRTDQLDGETDWKARHPVLQEYENDADLFSSNHRFMVYAEKPQMDIHSFIGTLTKITIDENNEEHKEEIGINVDNTMWANTVLAAGNAVGLVIYTGRETRSVMNNSAPRSKTGLIDLEINNLTKILFVAVIALAFLMICLKGFEGPWHRYWFRFVLLFSYIIPISLRVNMDMAKSYYAWAIQQDQRIAGTVARSTTIPEDLGRISYLLTDKTGTLTQNEMIFKRLVLATCQADSPEDVRERLKQGLRQDQNPEDSVPRVTEITRVTEAIKALAICHNVTPVYDTQEGDNEIDFGVDREATYQASSPDEIALVRYAKDVGLSLVRRDLNEMTLKSFDVGISLQYEILHVFSFKSETRRMGIIVRDKKNGEIVFYLKGADGVMKDIVRYNDWLDEACGNMAREGLRTLVVAKKFMSQAEYVEFDKRLEAAKSCKTGDRPQQVYKTMCSIEKGMDLLCVTGVEDTLQKDVKVTLETLRNAGIKIWMLTGDKLETATCIAKSSKLVATQQEIFTFKEIKDRQQAFNELNNFRRKSDAALVIKGDSLEICLKSYEKEFMELACGSPVVIVCRCSPTQKARMVELVQKTTGKRTAAIGDGGNDVAMIQSADVGIGIEGKEGRQASLAADFSILQFSFVATLLLVHGRYSYKRSASLAQFVMHRGLIITVMQAVFSSIFYFSSVALYQGFLMIGYATVYTMLPVFALVLDKDVKVEDLLRLPELYAELGRGRSLTLKTFFLWVMISVYQGGILMYGALILFRDEFIHIVSISFTALIFTELIMVALTIRNMHKLMIVAEVISFLFYVVSLVIFRNYFDSDFILSINFMWKVTVITLMSCAPIFIIKYIRQVCAPPNYAKLN